MGEGERVGEREREMERERKREREREGERDRESERERELIQAHLFLTYMHINIYVHTYYLHHNVLMFFCAMVNYEC